MKREMMNNSGELVCPRCGAKLDQTTNVCPRCTAWLGNVDRIHRPTPWGKRVSLQ